MKTAEYFHWLCSVPIGLTLCVFGLLGNTISILVWRKLMTCKYHRVSISTAMYLITLGVCDNGLLLFFILIDSLPAICERAINTYAYVVFYSWCGYPIFFIFVVASIWLVVGIAVNRYIMILFPLHTKLLCTKRKAYIGIILTLSFSLIVNIPHFFNFHPAQVNGTFKLEKTKYGSSKNAKDYEFWMHCLVLVFVPWFTVAVLNVLIIIKLRNMKMPSALPKNGLVRRTARERGMTIMLLAVSFVFLLLLAWQCITQCFFMLEYKKEKATNDWMYIDVSFAFAKLGIVINSAINSALYCFSGATFRRGLVKLISSIWNVSPASKLQHSIPQSETTSQPKSNSISLK